MLRTLNLPSESEPVRAGHLNLGGVNPQGQSLQFTNLYVLRDGEPCIPCMGEFHFSRYANQFWEEELLKTKAGGIDIVATYVFWNHIEEDEGVFDWSKDNDLRCFVELCGCHHLQALVRIGPFAHGECRNGGLPDWLYGRPFALRSNDPRYLAYVERFYSAIADQLKGLLFKDGGPVIGVQLENEYMHAGAPWETTFRQGTEWVPGGSDGASHLANLKRLALKVGLEVPLYSCTAWLNSPVAEGEMLPMQGGYAFTPWNPDPNFRQSPTREYLFRDRRAFPVVNGPATYNSQDYPLACCEMGGGIQITYYHRPIVPPESVEAMAVLNLAGGANLLGYYMYHGGSQPTGKHSYMNEFTVPRISYDFQAPIQEFGQIGESFRSLRILHSFLREFGPVLAPMTVTLPADASAISPEDTSSLRWAVRADAKSGAGFLCLNNYQDHMETRDIPDIRLQLNTAQKTISIPRTGSITLQKNVTAMLPFNLSLEGVLLEYATTQLLTRIESETGVSYFFFSPRGMTAEYVFHSATYQSVRVLSGEVAEADDVACVRVTPGTGCVITLTNARGRQVQIITLTRDQAEHACKVSLWDQDRLVISDSTVVLAEDECYLYSVGGGEVGLAIYPPVAGKLTTPVSPLSEGGDGIFTRYSAKLPTKDVSVIVEMLAANKAVVTLPPHLFEGVHNVFLHIDYVGDIGNCFIEGQLVSDNFYNGTAWEIGLKQVMQRRDGNELYVLITPTRPNSGGVLYLPTGMAFSPSDEAGIAAIQSIKAVPEYRIPVTRIAS